MNDSPIFIVGCPRSGTGLLRDLLRAHPRLTFPTESHFIPTFYRGYGDPHTEREAVDLAARILRLEWIRSWNVALTPADFAPDRSYHAVVSRLFEAWARKENKPRWGDKTPHGVLDIAALVEVFPAAKVVHIIRDGRDVALSWLKTGFEPRNLFTAANLWKRYVSAGRDDGATLPRDTFREIRYESLLSRPADTMRDVCEFVGETFSEAVLHPNYLPRIMRPAIIGTRTPRVRSRTEIDPANLAKWKTDMTPSDRVLFESVAGDLLSSLGYEIDGVARPISAVERLAWAGHHEFWWAIDRLNTKGSHRWLLTDLEMRRAGRLARRKAVDS
jgi:hypothetical protein